jgi:hypothetical protein
MNTADELDRAVEELTGLMDWLYDQARGEVPLMSPAMLRVSGPVMSGYVVWLMAMHPVAVWSDRVRARVCQSSRSS